MKMRSILTIAVTLSFQVTFLSALCQNLDRLYSEHPKDCNHTTVSPNETQLLRTADKISNFTIDHGNEAHPTNRAGANGSQHSNLDEISAFRLEYNKYKILSHLGITSNVDEITPKLDEELRYRLLTSTMIKQSMTNEETTGSSSRRKRALTCDQVKNEKSTCCLDNFYVNFTHIGWDKWILYPPGYKANYCQGKCDLSHARYFHSTLLSKYSNVVSLCCSPRQMAPLNLLYIDEENKVHQKSIPDMVVESCDCA